MSSQSSSRVLRASAGGARRPLVRVCDDLFEWLLRFRDSVSGELLVGREVGAGDLETVEEESGATGIDGVGGQALEDASDGELDGGAVFGDG